MAVERAPYIDYTEITSYMEEINNGSEIPLFIVKTGNEVEVSDIKPSSVKEFRSYGKFKQGFSIPDDEESYNALDESVKELDKIVKKFFSEDDVYGEDENYGLNVQYIYMIDVGNNPTIAHYKKALSVSETKRKSTAIAIPNTEDIDFMKEVGDKLIGETKFGLYRIAYFKVSGQGKLLVKFAKGTIVTPTFDHHGFVNVDEGYMKIDTSGDNPVIQGFYKNSEFTGTAETPNANLVYKDLNTNKYYTYSSNAFVETTLDSLDGYSEVIEGYKKDNETTAFYDDSEKTNAITPSNEALYLDKSTKKTYTYDGTNFIEVGSVIGNEDQLVYETDDNYKFIIPSTKSNEMGGASETFEQYLERLSFISQEVQSSRVAIVDEKEYGRTIARICSTPYYIEPGYLPYMSLSTGVFEERDRDERDALFATGLIFGEDDYNLSVPTPRICVATSTAWGIKNPEMRTTDALIHARRNVDHQVREILKIIAPQLKRNETSVALRHVINQVDLYLDGELEAGTIVEYKVNIYESSYNPYKLLVKGKIVPVNSTLAIEFENTIGSPYTIASDYL